MANFEMTLAVSKDAGRIGRPRHLPDAHEYVATSRVCWAKQALCPFEHADVV